MHATLVVVGGTADKRQLNIELPTVLGRSKQADLRIAHSLISRKHCELREHEGIVFLTDLGSLNGTICRDRRIQRVPLMPNDRFSIGPLTFEIRYECDRQEKPAPGTSDAIADNDLPIELSDPILPVTIELDDPVEPSVGERADSRGQTVRIDLPLGPRDRHFAPLDVPTSHSRSPRGDGNPPDR